MYSSKFSKTEPNFQRYFALRQPKVIHLKSRPTDREKVFLENDSRKTTQRSKRSVAMLVRSGKYLFIEFQL